MPDSPPLPPRDQRYFEDYQPGAVYLYGPGEPVTAETIIAFARDFDPQAMHTDPAAAEAGPTKGLIASGWHTTGLMMRLFVDHYISGCATYPAPGIDELRWLRPVRPGDRLSIRVTVVETRRSRSKPDRGLVTSFVEALGEDGQPVMSLKALNLIGARTLG
jgi:acyl dehydratase